MKTGGKHHIAALSALLLLALYALCILGVMMSGAEVFSRLGSRDEAAFDRRSLESYIAAKLRQSDFAGGVRVEEQSLILAAEAGYETRIYCHEGWLWESFTLSGAELDPGAGEKLLPAESLSPRWEDGLLVVELRSAGESSLLRFHLKSCGEVSP